MTLLLMDWVEGMRALVLGREVHRVKLMMMMMVVFMVVAAAVTTLLDYGSTSLLCTPTA
jgi:hypothetical protein